MQNIVQAADPATVLSTTTDDMLLQTRGSGTCPALKTPECGFQRITTPFQIKHNHTETCATCNSLALLSNQMFLDRRQRALRQPVFNRRDIGARMGPCLHIVIAHRQHATGAKVVSQIQLMELLWLAELGHFDSAILRSRSQPAQCGYCSVVARIRGHSNLRGIPGNLAALHSGNTEAGQRLGEHDQVALAQQLEIQGDVTKPINHLAVERHDARAELKHIHSPAHDRGRFTDKVEGVLA
ncbi:hypothetical protein D3C77_231620 [compost metagenome]